MAMRHTPEPTSTGWMPNADASAGTDMSGTSLPTCAEASVTPRTRPIYWSECQGPLAGSGVLARTRLPQILTQIACLIAGSGDKPRKHEPQSSHGEAGSFR